MAAQTKEVWFVPMVEQVQNKYESMTDEEKKAWFDIKPSEFEWLLSVDETDDVNQYEWKQHVNFLRTCLIESLDYALYPYVSYAHRKKWAKFSATTLPVSFMMTIPSRVSIADEEKEEYEQDVDLSDLDRDCEEYET